MTKQLEALIAEMKAAAEGAKDAFSRYEVSEILVSEFCDAVNKYKSYTFQPDNLLALISALEQSQRENIMLKQGCENDPRLHEIIDLKERIAELEASHLAVKLPDLNEHFIAILGRPNFTCTHLAELLRGSGVEIRRKSDNEQAAVIHYLLNFYLEYGGKWESIAKEDIQSKVATQTASGPVQGDG